MHNVYSENNILYGLQSESKEGSAMDGYTLEITTNFFRIDMKTGALLVNEPNLDRDPPSSDRLTFQIRHITRFFMFKYR